MRVSGKIPHSMETKSFSLKVTTSSISTVGKPGSLEFRAHPRRASKRSSIIIANSERAATSPIERHRLTSTRVRNGSR